MSLQAHYGALSLPVAIMAGDGDKVVSDRLAQRLHRAIPGSTLQIIPGVGHMIHHSATDQVTAAILAVASACGDPDTPEARPSGLPAFARRTPEADLRTGFHATGPGTIVCAP
jgi:hypothetical protein